MDCVKGSKLQAKIMLYPRTELCMHMMVRIYELSCQHFYNNAMYMLIVTKLGISLVW